MDKLEQIVASMLTGAKSETDWLFETQHRELAALEHKLAAAELVLERALSFVREQRQRVRGAHPAAELPKNPIPRVVQQGPRQQQP